jgi:ParB family transcriptional regulator, chromosome partitioning protein
MNNMAQLEAAFDTKIVPGAVKDAMKAAGASSGDLYKLGYDKLHIIEGFNLRVHNDHYQAKLEERVESLTENGWYAHHPMGGLVQRDKNGENIVYIFDGHTRLAAIPLANAKRVARGLPPITEVTVIAIPTKKNGKDPITMADLTVAMVQGNKGNPHTAYELALACRRLADDNLPVAEIARQLTLSGEWVKSLLLLTSAPLELRQRVADEALTVTLAVQLLKEHGDEAAEMVEEAAAEKEAQGKPVKLTRKNIKPTSPFTKAVKRSAPAMYDALEKVKADPAFAQLDAGTREKLLEVMTSLERAKDDGAVDHSKQTTIFDKDGTDSEGSKATA